MKRLLVLGAGTAGTMVINKLRRRLDPHTWQITVVDRDDSHVYQPGLLFVPFGAYRAEEIVKPRGRFVGKGAELLTGEVEEINPVANTVRLIDGRVLPYDYLVIASGTTPRPDQTPGMLGSQWRKSIFDFYTYEGATALAPPLRDFQEGRLVVHIVDMPIKCPVAPLEFAFLADAFFRERGIRDRIEIVYATPLSGAFTKPVAAERLGAMLDERKILIEPDFVIERVDPGTKTMVSFDERKVPFDLLVTVPLNMGADFVARSGLGDELNYVPVDRHTMLSKAFDNIFVLGDANDIPTSKAGSVAHFSVEVFADNFLQHVAGQTMTGRFDGHANCFVESGDGKALLIDFNYETEPLPGRYPLPGLGPFSLMEETALNHQGKLAFRWMYWNLLLPGRPIPLPAHMSTAGKHLPSGRGRTVSVATVGAAQVHVDSEGFLTNYDEWDEGIGVALAKAIGIELTEAHWRAIRFLREDYLGQGETATLRRVSTLAGIPVKELFTLFPKKPAKKMAYIAGLPKPRGCV